MLISQTQDHRCCLMKMDVKTSLCILIIGNIGRLCLVEISGDVGCFVVSKFELTGMTYTEL